MSDGTRRSLLIMLGLGILLCTAGIVWQVMWWSSACWAFADEVQSGRVKLEEAMDVSRGFIGHKAERVLVWTAVMAALGLTSVIVGSLRRSNGNAAPEPFSVDRPPSP